ncbi:MAG: hypothetical protein ACWIPJ_09135 [Polaribacter sp.]
MLVDGFSCVKVGKILLLDDDTIRKYRNTHLNQVAQSKPCLIKNSSD